jgi:hypothetical protein
MLARAVRQVAAALWLLLNSAAVRSEELHTFAVAQDPAFSDSAANLRGLLAPARAARATFCLLGVEALDGGRVVWVEWPARHKLFLWEGQDLAETPPRRMLDLRKDVVATDSDLQGSTYKVTKAWVSDIKNACARVGTKISVERRARPR